MPVDLQHALREHFGFAEFRGPQRAICEHVLRGGDALVIMATGDGKSLCYQLPGLMLPGLTLVVSPLIALMDDQVAALEQKELPATCVHSMLDAPTRKERLQRAVAGDVKLLYVTPERFRVPGFREAIAKLDVSLLAIDEAHCVSQWGHDFRPDYSELGRVRAELGDPPTLALTATATPAVQEDIVAVLRIGDAQRFCTGIERPNLFLSVRELDRVEDKIDRVLEVIEHVGGPGIVYHALIRDLCRTEDALLRRGFKPLVYHGDLSANERREQQAAFIGTRDRLILATNAFGMGVDKPDIRFILHYQVPRTLEAYYQEIGRAGRDGRASLCELLYVEEDVSIQREFTEWANPDREFMQQVTAHLASLDERVATVDVQSLRETFLVKNKRDGRIETCLRLLRTAGCSRGDLGRDFAWLRTPDADEIAAWLPDDKRKRDLTGLLEMVRYARDGRCRKRKVHDYFGFAEAFPEGCGACDVCTDSSAWLDRELAPRIRTTVPREAPGGDAGRAPGGDAGRAPGGDPADGRLSRGDWIDVRGHGLCAVTRVHRLRSSTRVDVERARDLKSLSFDLGRVRWKRV